MHVSPRSQFLLPALLISSLLLQGCSKKAASPASAPQPAPPQSQASPPPPPPPVPAPTPTEVPRAAADGNGERELAAARNYAVVRVFYATDRQPTGTTAPGQFYGGDRQLDESIHLGTLDVSIPRDHRMGSIERPSIWKLEFRPDPDKHVVLLSVLPKSDAEFYTELANKVQSSANKDAFVFVHGFDNTFEQAAWRTAQLSYDLGFQGAPIMYSWPSKGKLAAYTADEATIDWATPHLEKFLETVAVQSHATTVHLIAHSMGNRALTRALFAIAEKHAGVPPMFKHVFLAAPDIDVGVFRQLAATFPSAATDVTLYSSSRDEAIMASVRIHQFDRVGDSTHICVVPKIDTVDASAVDTGLIGHAYFGDKRSILSDMFEVMQTGSPPGKRFGMHSASLQQMTYWVFNP
jgi:esterase/lipase superfamily enzyme